MGGCLSIRIRENVMKCINVKCEGKPAYDIVIESGFEGLSEAFNKLEITGRKLCIVTDSNVGPLYAEQVKNELEKTGNAVYVYTFAAGEENKTLDTVQDVYEYLIENQSSVRHARVGELDVPEKTQSRKDCAHLLILSDEVLYEKR